MTLHSGCDTLIAQAITGDTDDVLAIPASFMDSHFGGTPEVFTAGDALLAVA